MKIFSSLAIVALLLLCACGNENTDADTSARPVDVWQPYVQVAPPGNIWGIQTNESESNEVDPRLAHQEKMALEINRLYNFFAPGQTLGGWNPDFRYPDYFGGFGWDDDLQYLIVLIVEDMVNEASEFLTYLEDFETVEIHFSPHGFNKLMYLQNLVWGSDIYPMLWWSRIDTITSRIIVYLFNYSEEEKEFFREYVIDSPIIDFVCMFETHGGGDMVAFLEDPPPFFNQLENVTITAYVHNTHSFIINIHDELGMANFIAYYCVLDTYLNGRWVAIYERSLLFDQNSGDFFDLKPGATTFTINTEHFTRQFEGPFRINVFIEQTNPFGRHHLTYIFSHGG